MSMIEPARPTSETIARAERALRIPMGAASPLWLLYAGAAGAGMAYWWITRWTKPANLEALLGAGRATAEAAVEAVAPAAEAIVDATEAAQGNLDLAVEEALHAAPPPEPEPEPRAAKATQTPEDQAMTEALSLSPPAEEPIPAPARKAASKAGPKAKGANGSPRTRASGSTPNH